MIKNVIVDKCYSYKCEICGLIFRDESECKEHESVCLGVEPIEAFEAKAIKVSDLVVMLNKVIEEHGDLKIVGWSNNEFIPNETIHGYVETIPGTIRDNKLYGKWQNVFALRVSTF